MHPKIQKKIDSWKNRQIDGRTGRVTGRQADEEVKKWIQETDDFKCLRKSNQILF